MKRASEIIEFLSQPDAPRALLLAPNAPPVSRGLHGIEVAMNIVLDGGDIYDTLSALLVQAGGREDKPLRDSGSFSFAVPSVGRFRVHYATQRGTKVARIEVIPFNIPTVAECCEDPEVGNAAAALVASGRPGMLAVTGPHAASNSMLVYALLRSVNESQRAVVYAVERTLSYLIAHGESIVIQTELGADLASLEQGISNALLFDPSILFVGDVRPADALPSLTHAIGSGVMSIASSVSIPGTSLLQQYMPAAMLAPTVAGTIVRCTLHVAPREKGRIAVKLMEIT